MNKIIVIDFGVFLHRAIFASLKNQGIPATYTCLNMIISCLKKIGVCEQDKIIIAADGRHSWRKDLDKTYKSGRKSFRESFPIDWDKEFKNMNWLLEQIDRATNWNIIKIDTIEADDTMAVVPKVFTESEIVFVTTDSDIEQLMFYNNVKIFSPLKKCRGQQTKGAYKIKPINFNPFSLLSKKIEKEKTDGLVAPIVSQTDYKIRELIVNLLELPTNIKNVLKERLQNLPEKKLNLEHLPFESIRSKFRDIYKGDKIITYNDSKDVKKIAGLK